MWIVLVISLLANVAMFAAISGLVTERDSTRKYYSYSNNYVYDTWSRAKHWALWDARAATERQYQKAVTIDKSHECIYREEFERTRQKLNHMVSEQANLLE